jgi:hypothetical protein
MQDLLLAGLTIFNLVCNGTELYAAVDESLCIFIPDAVDAPCLSYQVATHSVISLFVNDNKDIKNTNVNNFKTIFFM